MLENSLSQTFYTGCRSWTSLVGPLSIIVSQLRPPNHLDCSNHPPPINLAAACGPECFYNNFCFNIGQSPVLERVDQQKEHFSQVKSQTQILLTHSPINHSGAPYQRKMVAPPFPFPCRPISSPSLPSPSLP